MLKDSVLTKLPCQFPPPTILDDTDPKEVARAFEEKLATLIHDDFMVDAIWRDCFAYTGTIRTFYGYDRIFDVWTKLKARHGFTNVKLDPQSPRLVRLPEKSTWIEARYNFETTGAHPSRCKAIVSLVPGASGGWQIWVLRTILDQIKDLPNVDRLEPRNTQNHVNRVSNSTTHESTHFDCVVVGGGQAGLSVAGRLKALNVSYVVLDKYARVGDNWRLRYDSARLHTNRASSHLPYERTFPSSRYGQFLSKDDLAQGYVEWAEKFDINVWTSTELKSGEWVQEDKMWKLDISNGNGDHPQKITARHVVVATGAGGQIPKVPQWPGALNFKGTLMHSSRYKNATAWKGKHAIVIGTANTAHDVAEDMVDAGCASVTMVQRSPTYVFETEYFEKVQDMVYNDNIPTEIADMSYLTNPVTVTRLMSNHTLHARTKADAKKYDALEEAGFKLIRYGDVIHQLYECFGGHYMNIDNIAKITKGLVKIKSDAQPVRFGPSSLIFDDGTELDADIVLFATGFEGNTKSLVRDMFGTGVANQIEDFWGLDNEGEIQGAFRPTGHPGLWMMGGSLGQARFWSRYIAFHVRADVDGKPLQVYKD